MIGKHDNDEEIERGEQDSSFWLLIGEQFWFFNVGAFFLIEKSWLDNFCLLSHRSAFDIRIFSYWVTRKSWFSLYFSFSTFI